MSTIVDEVITDPVPGVSFVRVREWGSGAPLLLINGLSRPIESWAHVVEALEGRHIIAFDAPGVGLSPRPAYPLLMTALSSLAVAVLDAFTIDSSDVLGYSHGGAVAQQIAIDHPGRINHLILAGTTPGLGAPIGNLLALSTGPQDQSWPRADSLGVTWRLAAIATWSSLSLLSTISVPTLVIAGAHDEIVPLATSQILASRIPGATLEVLATDHDLQTPAAAPLLASAVTKFINK